ncbi:MAG: radical SAM protein [Puniceicoccales bacterium]
MQATLSRHGHEKETHSVVNEALCADRRLRQAKVKEKPPSDHHHEGRALAGEPLGADFADWAPTAFIERSDSPLCLYLHVPFCRHRCAFCPFYRNAHADGFSADYAALLHADIDRTARALGDYGKTRRVDAVFFGGGTPSDLEAKDLAGVIVALKENFLIDAETEITVEGRFRDFTTEKARAWVAAGANRFSLGLQTADVGIRRRLGRLADRDEMRSVLTNLADTGALVIVDLIYGLPGQTTKTLAEDIRFLAEETPVDGLDCYELKQFPGSPLAKMLENGRLPPAATTDERSAMFRVACDLLDAYGFDHFMEKHWRRNESERSLYNRFAKNESVDVLPFGSGAGGRLGQTSIMRDGVLVNYRQQLLTG